MCFLFLSSPKFSIGMLWACSPKLFWPALGVFLAWCGHCSVMLWASVWPAVVCCGLLLTRLRAAVGCFWFDYVLVWADYGLFLCCCFWLVYFVLTPWLILIRDSHHLKEKDGKISLLLLWAASGLILCWLAFLLGCVSDHLCLSSRGSFRCPVLPIFCIENRSFLPLRKALLR